MKYFLLVLVAVCINFGLSSSISAAEESTPAVPKTAEKACPTDSKTECCEKKADAKKDCCKTDAKKSEDCKKADAATAPKQACCPAKKEGAAGISAEAAKTPVSANEK